MHTDCGGYFELHVNKRKLHTLYAGTDAFKCIAQEESTDV